MCGIFGYIGKDDPLATCVKGLELLEYRGYDSTGLAGVANGKLTIYKETGKLYRLKEVLKPQIFSVAIGHTRWATHGKVSKENAHPHFDAKQEIAVVHNGIIENYEQLRQTLQAQGVFFHSDTDTEVVAHLIAKHYAGNLLAAVQQILPLLKGQFALAIIHKNHPDQIIAVSKENPLAIGFNDEKTETILSSDPNAFLGKALNVLFLRNLEIALIEKQKVTVYAQNTPVQKRTEKLDLALTPATKEGYPHFMLKEIFEQPSTIQKALAGRVEESGIQFEALPDSFTQYKQVLFIGCGTSAHAGIIGSYFLEDIARIPASYEIASEVRLRVIPENTLIVAISQSGETADTIAAVRELRSRNLKVLGICNVKNSTLTRESDACIFLKAGPEMSVCSTKAFTSQIAVLYLLALKFARLPTPLSLSLIPSQIANVLSLSPIIEKIALKYSHYSNFFFMGRRYMYPTAMEAALKLKEISYANANAYPAGELKHGPIALLDSNFPVIAFCANEKTADKILSNLQEVKARGAPLLAIAPSTLPITIADDVIYLPPTTDELSPFASTIAGQLLAYHIALAKGCDIDQPRNLAKSVTVE